MIVGILENGLNHSLHNAQYVKPTDTPDTIMTAIIDGVMKYLLPGSDNIPVILNKFEVQVYKFDHFKNKKNIFKRC